MRSFRSRLALLLCVAGSLDVPAEDVDKGAVPPDVAPTPRRADLEVEGGFPIAVWVQDPRNAGRYKAIGISAVQPDTLRPLIAKIGSMLTTVAPAAGAERDAAGAPSPVLASHS